MNDLKKEMSLPHIPKEDRKTILLLSDDIRLHSGIATMAKEIVLGTSHRFNWVNLGAALKHPDAGKRIDLSDSVNKEAGIEDASVILYPNNGYGDANILRHLMKTENPSMIFHFTDPRYWVWLYQMEREVRSQIPISYLNIWDDYPTPLYNKNYYDSCDLLMGISKQTVNINKLVLGDNAQDKVIEYVPHGINEDKFRSVNIDDEIELGEFTQFKTKVLGGKEYDFIVLFNSRNIRRKSPGDVILSYRQFCDQIGKEKAKRCALVMHTQPVDNNGTDLHAVKEAICDPEYVNVHFSATKLDTKQMNFLYNMADATMLISSNEGWGLSLTESMMAGTMIIANVTGGMQDQMRFVDDNGDWYTPSKEVPSNHMGTYKECGKFAVPVFPSNISLVGSVPTPYIHDDRCDFRDVANAIQEVYELSPEDREERGVAAREWVTSKESQMSARHMCDNIIDCIEKTFETFKPRKSFEFIKIEEQKPAYVQHAMVY